MLTTLTMQSPFDEQDAGAGCTVSVTELARIKGVSKQSISKRLNKLESEGLLVTGRRGKHRTVSLATWDTVTGETTDPARLVAQETARAVRGDALEDDVAKNIGGGKPPADPTYTRELTRKAGYDADLRKIEIDKQRRPCCCRCRTFSMRWSVAPRRSSATSTSFRPSPTTSPRR